MSVAEHDEILAQTSHLPHLLAFNLIEQLAASRNNLDIFRYAAGGLRDFSRIAASDPQMWRDAGWDYRALGGPAPTRPAPRNHPSEQVNGYAPGATVR